MWQPIHANLQIEGMRFADTYRFRFAEVYEGVLEGLKQARGEYVGVFTLRDALTDIFWGRVELTSSSKRQEIGREFRKMTGDKTYPIEQALAIAFRWALDAPDAGEVEDWDVGEAHPPEYLVKPFVLDKTVTILAGDGGAGKGYFTLWLCLTAQAGRELVSGFVPRYQGLVLYLDYETSAEGFYWKRDQFVRGMGLSGDNYRLKYKRLRRPYPEIHHKVLRLVRELEPALVVLDSLGFAMQQDVETSGAALTTINQLLELDCAVLAIAHISKAAAESKNPTPYGSVFVKNGARAVWMQRKLMNTPDGFIVRLDNTKLNVGREWGRYLFEFRFGSDWASIQPVTEHTRPEVAEHLSLNERILFELARQPQSKESLAEQLGEKSDVVKARLTELKRARRITIVGGDGTRRSPFIYALVDPFASEGDPFE